MNSRILLNLAWRQLTSSARCGKPMPHQVRMMSAMPITRDMKVVLMPKPATCNLSPCRYKSKKSRKQAQRADSDDVEVAEEDDGDEEDLNTEPGEKLLKVAQLRTDKVLRLALNNSRIIDEGFLEGRIYRNESKVIKKATEVQEGDILDVELGPDPKNADFIKVHRVEILEIKHGNTHNTVRALINKNLTAKPFV